MANKSNFALKLVVVVALLVVAVMAGIFLLRPVAKVAVVTKGPAINAVPGNIVVQSASPPLDLKSEVGGFIQTIDLTAGKKVKKGDLLVQIDPRALQLEIDHFANDLASKQRQFEVGSIYALDLQAAQKKLELGNLAKTRGQISQVDLDSLQRVVDTIIQKGKLEEIENGRSLEYLKSSLDKDQLQKEKMSIRAPFDGVVTAVYTSEGALIGGNERIATLITDARTVEAKISEEDFAGIARGQKASVTFLSGAGGRDRANVYNAKVSKILPTADPETQRYLVDLEVEGVSPEDLIPGKTGEVTITIGQREAQAVVPRRALSGNRLYVVKNGKVEIRSVTPGFKWLEGEEILKGVEAGEEVIVEQQDQFHEGDSVKTEVDPTALAYEKKPLASPPPSAPAAGK